MSQTFDPAAAERIAHDLRDVGVQAGGLLLMHASLSALGWVPGGPATVIAGLRQALGPEGTLCLPGLSYATVHAQHPVFDVRRTPVCVGAIPEYFRTMPGVQRSQCPTHSVCAIGPLAEELLDEHHLDDTPCGPRSPWRKLPQHGGALLFLGCGLGPNTSMHGIEEAAQSPYLFGPMIRYRIVRADGQAVWQDCRRHAFAGWIQRYGRIAELDQDGWIRRGPVLQATAHLVQAAPLWEHAFAAHRRDRWFFVEREKEMVRR